MKTFRSSPSHSARGFSLVELLIVISIIAIIAGFAVPAVGPMLRGSSLSQGGTLLMDQMSLARQHALSRNRSVEVRFYKFGDPEKPGESASDPATGQYRAMQYFERADAGRWMPVSQVMLLPNGVMMNSSATLSTLLGEDKTTRGITKDQVKSDPLNHVELPRRVGMNYEYMFFHFQPNGGTDLSSALASGKASSGGLWHITLHTEADLPKTNPPASTQAPPNYVCWTVDPVSGIGKIYRPGM